MKRPVANGCLWGATTAIVLLAGTDAAWSQPGVDAVGEVIAAQGVATITRGGESAPAKPKIRQPLVVHDRLETGDRSALKALFRDDSLLTLGERTRLDLDDYVYDADRQIRRVMLALERGMVRALVGKSVADPMSMFVIKAGPVTIAVRATYAVVWIDQEGIGVVNIGTAGLIQLIVEGQGKTIPPGHFSIAPHGQFPRGPRPVTGSAPASVNRAIAGTDIKEDVGPTVNQLAEQAVEEELPSCPPGSPPGGVCPRKPPPTGLPPATPPAVTSGAARR